MNDVETENGSRSRRGSDRRRAILAAARGVFSEKGFEASSMAEIAAKVGVVEGALYKHFPSKRELLFEAARDHFEPRFQETREQLAGIHGTRNRMRFVIWRHLREFVDDPGMCRLIIHELRPYGDYQGSAVHDLIRENTRLLFEVLDEAKESGELRSGVRPAIVRDLVYGGIEHLAFRALAGRGSVDAEAVADEVTELVLGGVAHAGPENGPGHEREGEAARLRAQINRLEALLSSLGEAPRTRS